MHAIIFSSPIRRWTLSLPILLTLDCMYSDMVKGTSRAEVTLNGEKINHVALAIVELRESEGIKQAGRQLVSQ